MQEKKLNLKEIEEFFSGDHSFPKTGGKSIFDILCSIAAYVRNNPVFIHRDAVETIEFLISEIDRLIDAQLNLVLHHEKFQT